MVERGKPKGLMKLLLRFPILLYRAGLGGLFGKRFLLLNHTGRKTGKERQAVIEVMRHDASTDAYVVAAAWGEKSDWYRNLTKNPTVRITVGRARSDRRAEVLPPSSGGEEFLRYAQRYPSAFRTLTRTLTGEALTATPETCQALGERVPVVALRCI
jgi:deazaflavin-dependent oxidoreductase (nitroreductase family)